MTFSVGVTGGGAEAAMTSGDCSRFGGASTGSDGNFLVESTASEPVEVFVEVFVEEVSVN